MVGDSNPKPDSTFIRQRIIAGLNLGLDSDVGGRCPPLDSDTAAIPVVTNVVAMPSTSTRMPLDLIASTSDSLEVDTHVPLSLTDT
jgi:hypothetical protein